MKYTYEIFFNKYTKRMIAVEKINHIPAFHFRLKQIQDKNYIDSLSVNQAESCNRILEWLKKEHTELLL